MMRLIRCYQHMFSCRKETVLLKKVKENFEKGDCKDKVTEMNE